MMNTTSFPRRSVASLGVGATLALACAFAMPGAAAAADPVKLGVIVAASGGYSAYGGQGIAGFEYVVNKINEAGGIKKLGGAKIVLEKADDASDPAKAATAARRFASQDVAMIVGVPMVTDEMQAVSPVADRVKFPVFSIFAGGTNSPYLYSLGSPYGAGYAQTFVDGIKFLRDSGGRDIKTAALSHSDYEAGQQVAKELETRLKAAGIEVIGSVPLKVNATNYDAEVTKLNSMKPDVVVGLVTTHDGITLNQSRYNVGSDLLYVCGTAGCADKQVWKSLGDAIASKVLTQNLYAMTTFNENAKQESLQNFLKEVKAAKLDVPIGQNFVQGAQAARVVQQVLENAKSTKPGDILEAFNTVDIPPGSPDLYLAKPEGIEFDPKTRMVKDALGIIVRWNADGSQDVVWPPSLASAK